MAAPQPRAAILPAPSLIRAHPRPPTNPSAPFPSLAPLPPCLPRRPKLHRRRLVAVLRDLLEPREDDQELRRPHLRRSQAETQAGECCIAAIEAPSPRTAAAPRRRLCLCRAVPGLPECVTELRDYETDAAAGAPINYIVDIPYLPEQPGVIRKR
ncbi:uncharacterized protein [Triticum aestivum]|uniref:uncharacterized protein n=1 Tax=Triticum aestivum TaxID=4565 RepID=UPI001D003B2F|nr:uncharacterized protein LOC123101330 [Triticum aestivum]